MSAEPSNDFIAKLPLIVPWIDDLLARYENQARSVSSYGFPKLPLYYPQDLLEFAKAVVVPNVPIPPLLEMGLGGLGDFDQNEYSGITFKNFYFVRESEASIESLHFHELIHVIQWNRLGVNGFLLTYAQGLAHFGYRNSPLEKMAYQLQESFESSDEPFNVVTEVDRLLSKLQLNP
ncbi:MAG: hypothetical protein JW739_06335 [Opitutales bacterium]|nr:hypothetical protein [Opitutales bacterium]